MLNMKEVGNSVEIFHVNSSLWNPPESTSLLQVGSRSSLQLLGGGGFALTPVVYLECTLPCVSPFVQALGDPSAAWKIPLQP